MSYLLRPYSLIVLTMLLSIGAWIVPPTPGIRRGFIEHEAITPIAILILALWYGFLLLTSASGFHVGRCIPSLGSRHEKAAPWAPLSSPWPYVAFTGLALLGVIYTYAILAAKGALTAYFSNASGSSANLLHQALYQDYSIGFLSLRYVGVVSGAVAFYRIMRLGRCGWLELVNIVVVLAISFISGRMLLLWTMCGVLGGFTLLEDPRAKRRAVRVLWQLGVSGVVLLWVLNYSRNHLYYQASGSDSFVFSGLGEALSYLGTPIQVSLGVANHWAAAVHGAQPETLVEYEVENLTTNSALVQLLPEIGWRTFPEAGIQCFLFAGIAGWCSRQRKSYFYFGYPIICYGFAELWRLDLFEYGIFYCLLSVVLGVPFFFGGHWVRARRSPLRTVFRPLAHTVTVSGSRGREA